MPLLRQRATDTAALCVNCDAHYSNGLLVTATAESGGPNVLRLGKTGVTSAVEAQASDNIPGCQPSSVSPPGPTTAACHVRRGSIRQPEGWHQPKHQVEDTMPPAPRATPPVALQPRQTPVSTGAAQGSQPEAGVAARPATAPRREAAAAAGQSADDLAWEGRVPAPEAAGGQATAGRRTVQAQTAGVFSATEPPLPRMFPRSTAAQQACEPVPTGRDVTTGGGAADGPDDDPDDGCDYSPTADPRLGPFARDPADRAPATPDRCRYNI